MSYVYIYMTVNLKNSRAMLRMDHSILDGGHVTALMEVLIQDRCAVGYQKCRQ